MRDPEDRGREEWVPGGRGIGVTSGTTSRNNGRPLNSARNSGNLHSVKRRSAELSFRRSFLRGRIVRAILYAESSFDERDRRRNFADHGGKFRGSANGRVSYTRGE